MLEVLFLPKFHIKESGRRTHYTRETEAIATWVATFRSVVATTRKVLQKKFDFPEDAGNVGRLSSFGHHSGLLCRSHLLMALVK